MFQAVYRPYNGGTEYDDVTIFDCGRMRVYKKYMLQLFLTRTVLLELIPPVGLNKEEMVTNEISKHSPYIKGKVQKCYFTLI